MFQVNDYKKKKMALLFAKIKSYHIVKQILLTLKNSNVSTFDPSYR